MGARVERSGPFPGRGSLCARSQRSDELRNKFNLIRFLKISSKSDVCEMSRSFEANVGHFIQQQQRRQECAEEKNVMG